jgi:hypothetical protein
LSSPLTPEEAATFAEAKALAAALVPTAEIRGTSVVEGFPTDQPRCDTNGMYRNFRVYLRRETLANLATATGILVHERLHGTGLSDETREFENAMTALIGRLATRR